MAEVDENRLRRLKFRAWHRGTKENDLILGGFVERNLQRFTMDDVAWLERLMEEEDSMILAWVMGKAPLPPIFDTPLMHEMQKLDFITGDDR